LVFVTLDFVVHMGGLKMFLGVNTSLPF